MSEADVDGAGRKQLLVQRLTEHASQVLGTPAAEIGRGTPLASLGFDSLMSVELQEAISRDTGMDIPVLVLLQGHTLETLATYVQDHRVLPAAEPAPVPPIEQISEQSPPV